MPCLCNTFGVTITVDIIARASRANNMASLPLLAGRYGRVGGTRRESRSAVRPSRWRLCVRTHARQCLASNAPSPLEPRGRLARLCSPAQTARPGSGVLPDPSGACAGPMAPNGPANPPVPTRPHRAGAHGNGKCNYNGHSRLARKPTRQQKTRPRTLQTDRGRVRRGRS